MAARAFNGHRTAAGFAAAARLLAPPDAGVLVVFGAGRLAAPTLRYPAAVRPIHSIMLVGRSPSRTEALAAGEVLLAGGRPTRFDPAALSQEIAAMTMSLRRLNADLFRVADAIAGALP